jgi:DNA invertase Pin-like site-specific DNA recombinase
MPYRIGYARVSRGDSQEVAAQVEALKAAGCQKIFKEEASGGRWDRPELHRLLDQLREGDTVTVWKLDRLSRSLKDFIAILERIEQAGASFESLTEHIETHSPAGRMLAHMLGSFAEFERAMIRERTRQGLAYARSQGRTGGRRAKLSPEQKALIVNLVDSGEMKAAEAARSFKVSEATVSRLLSEHRQKVLAQK